MLTDDWAIDVKGLRKHFGNTPAVQELDLQVRRGSVFGLLGPNGAGKTTTVRMLATLLQPDAGHARVLGLDLLKDSQAIRQRISLTGQFASVDEDLSGRENLRLLARLLGFKGDAGRTRTDTLLASFDLLDAADKEVKHYSGGMRRRLDIAASLIVPPELLFLDEPTTGLDPRSRNQVWDIVRALAEAGTTVLLTTQYLEEADQLAERIAVIDHGRVIAEGTSSELKQTVGSGILRVRLADASQRPAAGEWLSQQLQASVSFDTEPASLSVPCADTALASQMLQGLTDQGFVLASFGLGQPSLDEVFLALTGQPSEAETTEDLSA
ncbi:daunorubicin/doxorubicin resistance ABC transporter ATP-binding protein DrrA [Saccharospirillum sp. MSK14-1]|uniref:ATP-binding cassette domain-containing protein n=1 Tax=Saccharospirillum sp. MSK14-1 TaxID=1897632 RepID=UPI000D3C6F38|nr:ATP-binding cassette domain-containing protein [Saccharospirillum sp. MSK14-1]PTY38772.1 daunorubicin/doxorubicin resistance ABC transporter ATP-binding protein DrrA [Saccharospirillum sp. MSK14-1]